jgi:hypothetical protein
MGELEATAKRARDIVPKELVAGDVDRTDLLYEAGRYAQTLQHVSAAAPECSRSLGPHDELCKRLLVAKARAMLRLGITRHAAGDIAQLEAMSADNTSPTLQLQALLTLLRLESSLGASPRQQAFLQKARAFGMSGADVPVNPGLKSLALLAVAEAHLLTGEPHEARRAIETVMAAQQGGGPAAPLLGAVGKSLLGVACLQLGRTEEALVWMKPGQEELAAGPIIR